ncbi:MAG: Smr/MutS family protein [Treponema sp.]|jgi:DNA-nicking Smr family endonuclease|nr:Smr/MutS family protein [Treponema sp.]MDR0511552.1 Smr/MutS family protein [Treponema sp.]
MNFGEILEKWERSDERGAKTASYVRDEDIYAPLSRGERRSRLLRKTPDDSIDLHGLSKEEAWLALEDFFEGSRQKGHEKVLIVHGKGSHRIDTSTTQSEGTLKELSWRFIEMCAFAGESGHSSGKEGGTGATWVILKE